MMAERLKSSDVASLSTGIAATCRAWHTTASRKASSPERSHASEKSTIGWVTTSPNLWYMKLMSDFFWKGDMPVVSRGRVGAIGTGSMSMRFRARSRNSRASGFDAERVRNDWRPSRVT